MTVDARPARIGIIGCGDVTRLYLPGLAPFDSIELVACADVDPVRAAALADRAGIGAMTVDGLLADPSIELVVVLTPPATHAAVALAAIAAGKHVYTEKPLATTLADARAVLDAAATAGVRVGAAPDTFLGAGLQTARGLIDEGAVGTPRLAFAAFTSLGPERWHPAPAAFYAHGAGPLLDVGPYEIAALVELLGPVRRVAAAGVGVGDVRTIGSGPHAGGSIVSAVPTSVAGTLEFVSGAIAALTTSFDVTATDMPFFEIHGTRGSLTLGDANWFDGFVRYRAIGMETSEDVPLRPAPGAERGVGVADLIDGLRTGRPHRASGDLAFHVLEVLIGLETAAADGRWVSIASTVER